MSEALINGLAGAGGGIVSQLITYPLQTVTTRKQTERDPEKRKSQPGTIDQICQVVKEQGWCHLYRGLAPSLVGIAASQDQSCRFSPCQKKQRDGRWISRNAFFTFGRCTIWTHGKFPKSSHPSENSTHAEHEALIAAVEPPFGTHEAIQEVYGEAGISGFWKGVIPTLIMVSNPSIQFMLYETMLSKLEKGNASNKAKGTGATAVETFFLGALAKLGAISVTYPLVVVKSRLQAKQGSSEDEMHHYKGTVDAFMKIIRCEGLSGLYTGMSTKIVQSVLAAAVLFMVKEEIVKGLRVLLSKRVMSGARPKSL